MDAVCLCYFMLVSRWFFGFGVVAVFSHEGAFSGFHRAKPPRFRISPAGDDENDFINDALFLRNTSILFNMFWAYCSHQTIFSTGQNVRQCHVGIICPRYPYWPFRNIGFRVYLEQCYAWLDVFDSALLLQFRRFVFHACCYLVHFVCILFAGCFCW